MAQERPGGRAASRTFSRVLEFSFWPPARPRVRLTGGFPRSTRRPIAPEHAAVPAPSRALSAVGAQTGAPRRLGPDTGARAALVRLGRGPLFGSPCRASPRRRGSRKPADFPSHRHGFRTLLFGPLKRRNPHGRRLLASATRAKGPPKTTIDGVNVFVQIKDRMTRHHYYQRSDVARSAEAIARMRKLPPPNN